MSNESANMQREAMIHHAFAEGDRSTNNQMNSIKTVFPEYTHGKTLSNKTGALTKSYSQVKFSKKVVAKLCSL